MLFLQAGSYNPGALIKGKNFWPAMLGQTDPNKLPIIIKTDKPRENFVEPYINKVLPELEKSDFYPYDIFVMSWAMADNTPIDADLPDAVKSWNEEYAFPRLVIASSTDILNDFEKKYGDELPELRGDFTEYWTDGLGTAAKQTAMNRTGKDATASRNPVDHVKNHGLQIGKNLMKPEKYNNGTKYTCATPFLINNHIR